MFFALAIATSAIGIAAQGWEKSQPLQREIFDAKLAEYPLTSLRRQDGSVNVNSHAQETDKAYFTFSLENESKIYSPNSDYKMKSEINNIVRNSGLI